MSSYSFTNNVRRTIQIGKDLASGFDILSSCDLINYVLCPMSNFMEWWIYFQYLTVHSYLLISSHDLVPVILSVLNLNWSHVQRTMLQTMETESI